MIGHCSGPVWLAFAFLAIAAEPSPAREPLVAPKPPPHVKTVDETELERMKTRLAAIVRSGSATDLAAELARIDRRLRSRHFSFEEQTLALEQYFRAIATTPGGHLPKFRAVCRPYALEIARQQPPSSMPVRLMRLQYSIALSHVAGVGAASASTAAEQREAVETLLVVWGHMEASFQTQASFGQPVDFEEVAAGRQFLSSLPLMAPERVQEIVWKYPYGVDPAWIKEPEARQAYENLLAAERRRMSEYSDAREVYLVMQGYDDQSRRFLEEVYGPGFANAPEFREAVARVIKDEDQARRIIDRLRPQP